MIEHRKGICDLDLPEGDIYEPEIKVNLYNGKIEGKQEAKGKGQKAKGQSLAISLMPFAKESKVGK